MMAKLSPEQRVIMAAIARAFGRELGAVDDRLDQASVIWQIVLDLAARGGLGPIVYAGLQSLDRSVPEAFRSQLRMGYLGSVARTEAFLEPTLRRLLEELGTVGVEPIVLKGAALAYTAYPDPVWRTMGDIDLLLPHGELERAKDVLRELGYLTQGADAEPDHHHLLPRYAPDWRLGVELHHHLLPESNPYLLSLEDCWSRRRTVEIAGVRSDILASVDALHFACLHMGYAHRYRWFPLRSLTDILAITTSYGQDLDWDLFVSLVRRSQTAGSVYWPLLLGRNWLEAPIPEAVLSSLAPTPLMRRLIGTIAEPAPFIDGQLGEQRGGEVLYNLLLNLSFYQGCSGLQQTKSVLSSLFPSPEAVGHLPVELTGSRLRYAAYLARPDRMARGIMAFGRLLVRLPSQ